MRLIACQPDTVWENRERSLARVRSLLGRSEVTRGALVALPEMFATGFSMNESAVVESPELETEAFLAEEAARRGVYLVGGLVSAASGRPRNEAVVFSPDGRELARYAKLHPFTPAGEHDHYEQGRDVVTFQAGPFLASPFICYDLRFPEGFRQAARRGAGLLVVIANWPAERQAHWRTLLVARAIENQAFVLGVNRVGRDPHVTYVGGSLVVSPRGEIVAEGVSEEGLAWADVDPETVADYRREFPALRDAWPAGSTAEPGAANRDRVAGRMER